MPGKMNSMGPRGFLTEEEKKNAPKITKDLLKRILSYLKPYTFQFVLVFITILISAGVGLLPSIITGKIVDQALVGEDMSLLIHLILMAFASLMASQVIGVLESYINAWISQRIIFDMTNEMYLHLEYMPHSFFTSEKQGDIITRMNTDISGVSSVISGTLSSIVSNIATVVTTLVALFSMSNKLAVVGIIIIPFLIIPSKAVGKKRYNLLTESQAKSDEMNQVINETLSVSGSLLVKLFTREKNEYDRFVKLNDEVTKLSLKEARSGKWFRVVMGMFTQVGPLLIYFAGGYLIINKLDTTLTVGAITATVSLINRLYRPVESLLNIGVDFTRSLALFTRIFDYLDRKSDIVSPKNGLKPELKNKDIEYRHIKFGYEVDSQILTDVNFKVPGGQMYAIVGPSGSGKSTVVNLLPRLYDPQEGSVCINDVDVRQMDLEYLRQNIGVVTQDTYLFNGTILDNLMYAKDDATKEEIEQACKIANIHDFIINQPDGYNTVVGNRGLKLSGGEKQRISIARVILKNPNILILDEATSALDSISESSIQDALETMMKGRTSLVIAHRLSTILKADKILVVKDGVIKEQGTHDELLALDGIYKELYETQFRQAIDYEENHDANKFPIETLSSEFTVKRIKEADVVSVVNLLRGNRKYYKQLGIKHTMRNLTDITSEFDEGNNAEKTNFVGFYDIDNKLIAILDLITDYPQTNDAYIGWFLVDAEKQRQGIGSQLFADIRSTIKAQGYNHLQLRLQEDNLQAIDFWEKQGFKLSDKKTQINNKTMVYMERNL